MGWCVWGGVEWGGVYGVVLNGVVLNGVVLNGVVCMGWCERSANDNPASSPRHTQTAPPDEIIEVPHLLSPP